LSLGTEVSPGCTGGVHDHAGDRLAAFDEVIEVSVPANDWCEAPCRYWGQPATAAPAAGATTHDQTAPIKSGKTRRARRLHPISEVPPRRPNA
jgi:hypothetical protein